MKQLPYIFAIFALTLAGCKPDSHPSAAEDSMVKTFEVQGILREVSPDHRTATIQHQQITGYMPAMTMPFNVKVPQELDGIEIGADIIFKLVVSTNEHWIEDIRFLALRIENIPSNRFVSTNYVSRLKSGEIFPDGELLTEDGKFFHFTDFRGKALAFTFFFSRCPLPEYCPRIASNFLKAREALLSDASTPTNWQFLSVSFDPGFDSPDVLTAYGNYARGATNTDRWLFASMPTNVLAGIAPKLGLLVLPEGEGITHNLRTVVLDPLGRIFWQFDGNNWTPEQLTDAITKAARFTQVDLPTNKVTNPNGLY
jgi:protein SCO1/2